MSSEMKMKKQNKERVRPTMRRGTTLVWTQSKKKNSKRRKKERGKIAFFQTETHVWIFLRRIEAEERLKKNFKIRYDQRKKPPNVTALDINDGTTAAS